MKLNNTYYIMRHGQSISNVKEICDCWPEKIYSPLTKIGRTAVKESAEKLKEKDIDMIFASPLLRTKQTSEIVGRALKVKPKFTLELKEVDCGIYNGQPFEKLQEFLGEKGLRRFKLLPKNGETYIEIKKRMVDFLKKVDSKYKGKNILFVSHELPLLLLYCAVKKIPNKDFFLKREKISTAELRKLN